MTDQPTSNAVLGPALSKSEALALENSAKRHWRTAHRGAMLFCVELRRLQDGGAHFVRGFSNFGAYAQAKFDGLSAYNAKQLSRQGGVLLELERHGRIHLGDPKTYPGTTGLRELSAVRGKLGEGIMLQVWDRADRLRPGYAVVDKDVGQALEALFPPMPAAIEPPGSEFIDDEEEDGDGLPEALRPLAARAEIAIDLARDLRNTIADGDAGQMRRAYRSLREELALIEEVIPAYGEETL